MKTIGPSTDAMPSASIPRVAASAAITARTLTAAPVKAGCSRTQPPKPAAMSPSRLRTSLRSGAMVFPTSERAFVALPWAASATLARVCSCSLTRCWSEP
ncbi:hypothetical protein D3C87_1458930 [compost metagenome]